MAQAAEKILSDKKLRNTGCRVDVLQLFMEQTELALSESEINGRLDHQYDRATIFRTIKTYLSNDIVHKVMADNTLKYALSVGKAHATHIHFQCTNCDNTTCLPDIEIENFELPKGYTVGHSELLISGTCPECV